MMLMSRDCILIIAISLSYLEFAAIYINICKTSIAFSNALRKLELVLDLNFSSATIGWSLLVLCIELKDKDRKRLKFAGSTTRLGVTT